MLDNTPWKTSNWWVSHFNFLEEVRSEMKIPDKVIIHDVTLRDGEQQTGITFRKDDKIKIAQKLDEVGVQRIEAGMAAISPEEKESIKAIANLGLDAKVFTLCRCMTKDVDRALDCDVDGVCMEIPSSKDIIKNAYNWTIEKAMQLSIEATKYAHDHGLYVSFFTMDSTRADIDWFIKLVESVASQGHMDSLTIVDTVGVCNSHAISYLVKKVKEKIKKPIEIHAHNDFGLGTANAIAAVCSGAEVIHTTVNGIGERSGNTSLEEVSLALLTMYGVDTGLKYSKFMELSRLVQDISGSKMPSNKSIVGENLFDVETGIVVWWMRSLLEHDLLLQMFPFKWDLVGQHYPKIQLGKMSGRDSIIMKAEETGITITDELINPILLEVKTISEQKKANLSDGEFKEILNKYIKKL